MNDTLDAAIENRRSMRGIGRIWVGGLERRAILAAIGLVVTVLAAAAVTQPSWASADDSNAIGTPIGVTVLNPPHPVLGADNRNHLAYELKVANLNYSVTLDSVQPRTHGKPFGPRLSGEALAARLRLDSMGPGTTMVGQGTTMAPGVGSTVFMDVTYPKGHRTPTRLTHRFTVTVPGAQPSRLSFTAASTVVRQRKAIELAPPLRGQRWLAADGCCGLGAHRSLLPIDGTIHVPERFAIDFSQLNAQNRLFTGPKDELSSYDCYGRRIHAVADGKVVAIQDGLPDQKPGTPPPHPTIQSAGGNYVVERIARHRYAFYAHMQPGSLRVKPGDRIHTGKVIGLLGNSGNSVGPHLHFHVMDSPSPLKANGLPFTFRSFRGQGVVTDEGPLFDGDPAPLDRARWAGPHHDQLPLNDQLLDFG